MSTHPSPRPYHFQFAPLTPNPQPHRNGSFHRPPDPPQAKNGKINFRYFCQHPQPERQGNGNPAERGGNPSAQKPGAQHKSYTFSQLAKEKREVGRLQAERGRVSAHEAMTPKYEFYMKNRIQRSETMYNGIANGQQQKLQSVAKTDLNHKNTNGFQAADKHPPLDKKYIQARNADKCSQESRGSAEKGKLRAEELAGENQLLRVSVEDARREGREKDQKIRKITEELKGTYQKIGRKEDEILALIEKLNRKESSKLKKEFKLQHNCMSVSYQPQKLQKQVTFDSNCLSITYQPQRKKQVRDSEQSTIDPTFDDFCSSLATLLQITTKIPSTELILAQLEKTVSKAQQYEQKVGVVVQLQKQRGRMLHHIKKKEAQIAKLISVNTFVNAQLIKNVHLVQEYNHLLTTTHLQRLQEKYKQEQGQKLEGQK